MGGKKNDIEQQIANLVAGIPTKSDEDVSIALTCKYMGWNYETYQRQPVNFIRTVNLLRQLEVEEAERQMKHNGVNH
jgi:hypothetical protein